MAPLPPPELCDWLVLAVLLVSAVLSDPLSRCPLECRCDAGFIYCNDRGLTAAPRSLPPDASVLYLQNNRIPNSGLPAELRGRTSLRVVYLYGNQLDQFPSELPPSLRELHLQDNNIRSLPRAALARLPLLEKLHLDDNSVSTASIEEDAFRDSRRLKLLFLSRNHLSSIPSGLPPALEELRVDDNRISTVPEHAFRGLASLRRLVMDGNLLANQRIADDAFARLGNLTELSLVRNSLLAPPANLPAPRLQRLYLQENAIGHVPRDALRGMRRLERLDLSSNNLTSLPTGLFRDLDSLSQLLLRSNPWACGCGLLWLRDWVRAASASVNVRGLMCQSPDRVRGMAIKDITTEIDGCLDQQQPLPAPPGPAATQLPPPQGSLFTLKSKRPGVRMPGPDSPSDGPSLSLTVKPVSPDSIQVSWRAAAPRASSFRLSWLRLGASPAVGSITETLVQGDRREYLLTALEPQSTYIICVGGMQPHDETPVCAKTATSEAGGGEEERGSPLDRDSDRLGVLSLAGVIGGATALVSLLLIFSIFCWYSHKSGLLLSSGPQASYSRGSRKGDDYLEAGTKKDNSILEVRGPGLQMTALNNQQPPREEYVIHTIFPSNGTSLYRGTHTVGYGSNRGYREGDIPDIDYYHT
ncbi:Leucine-rich repeat transmembrane protein FLRT1 [Acipenser ruthenus]|uniref:Leucine-rich repeat transmembrane protein FLRT1 n=1 Tax=Acipenser ruthenus TaxID=7906 RepID=A0A444UR55_ACIRT|nr:leucine-rich repeat transmembrane protein FLRT1 [Acipenser ruthenus]XP_058877077.1 leucine-rich repeat transmembrane protein FLRT1 [Acipenser ruthenus]XP_058877078.1 leucine-rich repeat transmembrane protein FLRT1 [Acipenser ruthenus]XP_058877079.1 leucine-rich repeat transmembrane protein FLRT1 [Acipenser ruthenus]RXM90645.1 Leucine-rich repeat transmembrane protein FLRT1 [Acipenser ruthenus]